MNTHVALTPEKSGHYLVGFCKNCGNLVISCMGMEYLSPRTGSICKGGN